MTNFNRGIRKTELKNSIFKRDIYLARNDKNSIGLYIEGETSKICLTGSLKKCGDFHAIVKKVFFSLKGTKR